MNAYIDLTTLKANYEEKLRKAEHERLVRKVAANRRQDRPQNSQMMWGALMLLRTIGR
jgi:hypothetical protein